MEKHFRKGDRPVIGEQGTDQPARETDGWIIGKARNDDDVARCGSFGVRNPGPAASFPRPRSPAAPAQAAPGPARRGPGAALARPRAVPGTSGELHAPWPRGPPYQTSTALWRGGGSSAVSV